MYVLFGYWYGNMIKYAIIRVKYLKDKSLLLDNNPTAC